MVPRAQESNTFPKSSNFTSLWDWLEPKLKLWHFHYAFLRNLPLTSLISITPSHYKFMPIRLTSPALKNHRSIECPNSSVNLHDTWLRNFRLLPDSLCSVFLGIPNVFLYVSQGSPNFESLPFGPLHLCIADHLLPWYWFSQLVVALLLLLFPIHRYIFRLSFPKEQL